MAKKKRTKRRTAGSDPWQSIFDDPQETPAAGDAWAGIQPEAPRVRRSKTAKTSRKPLPIDAALAKAIEDSGLTHYAIGLAAGVSSTTIDRFMYQDDRHRGLTLSTAAKIATALGLTLSRLED